MLFFIIRRLLLTCARCQRFRFGFFGGMMMMARREEQEGSTAYIYSIYYCTPSRDIVSNLDFLYKLFLVYIYNVVHRIFKEEKY
jgi:hypothetical protein